MHITDKDGKNYSGVNAAIIILIIAPEVETDMDVESAIMAGTVVLTNAVLQQAHTCFFLSFKLSHQKK